MCNILNKCSEKKEMREFIKYYRLLRKAKEAKEAKDEENVEAEDSISDNDSSYDNDSSSDYLPEDEEEENEYEEAEEEDNEERYKKYLYRRETSDEQALVNLQTHNFTPLMRAVLYQDLPAVQGLLKFPSIQVNQVQKLNGDIKDKLLVRKQLLAAYTALGFADNIVANTSEDKNKTALAIKNALLNHPGINKQLLYEISN
jgi:hypothetical protein